MAARPRAEDFLEPVQRGKRGRLEVYVGFAAGVGKTYRMLEEGHALRKRGVDVVIAFVETHGRADTAALRNTGVRVRETVPDSFLEQADQVVNLGLAVEDLHIASFEDEEPR